MRLTVFDHFRNLSKYHSIRRDRRIHIFFSEKHDRETRSGNTIGKNLGLATQSVTRPGMARKLHATGGLRGSGVRLLVGNFEPLAPAAHLCGRSICREKYCIAVISVDTAENAMTIGMHPLAGVGRTPDTDYLAENTPTSHFMCMFQMAGQESAVRALPRCVEVGSAGTGRASTKQTGPGWLANTGVPSAAVWCT